MISPLVAPVAASGMRWPLRIVLLGNAYNPLSIACLEALVAAGHDVRVGIHNTIRKTAPFEILRRRARARGGGFVLRRAVRLTLALTRLGARRLGLPLRGALSLEESCLMHRVPRFACADPNTPAFVARIRAEDPDLIVLAAFGRILKRRAFTAARLGCVNVHPSVLPRHRGPYPSYWIIANREPSTGVTIHWVDEGIDTGPIIAQLIYPVEARDTEARLDAKAARAGSQLLAATLATLAAGVAQGLPQDERRASHETQAARVRAR